MIKSRGRLMGISAQLGERGAEGKNIQKVFK